MNRLISSLSIVLLLALCFLTQAAQAYTCADVPATVDGDVIISESGACTIDHPVMSTGKVRISASSINAPGFLAETEVDLEAQGDITITEGIAARNYYVHLQGNNINVSGPISTVYQGNILLVAQQNLATGTISAAPGFNIDLKANVAGGNVPFTIGSSGQSNGVNGAIIAHTYGYQAWLASAIVYVTNGDSNSTGGITVTDPASLSLVANGRERAGYLYLNAQKGTLSLPSGAIALDGTATAGAGVIGLMADTVAFGADAILSASEAIPQSTMHGIAISANTITYQGVDGLKLLADGPGMSHDYRGFVRIFPAGGINMVDNQDPSTLIINGNYVLSPPGGVAITGDAGSPLLVSANGSHNLVSFVGQPLSFAGGAVTLSAQGVEDHNIEVLNAVGSSLTFANMGDVILDASGQADNSNWPSGGTIDFYAGDTSISSPQIRFLADGPTGASGNGGIVNIVTTAFNLDAASKARVSANGGAGGGDASQNAITFNPGTSNFKIGSDVGQISFSARGGDTSGSAGVIKLLGNSSAVTVYGAGETSTTIDVSAPGSDGNGGEIHLTANNGLTFDGTSSFLKADGGSSAGAGGKIVIHTAVKPVVIGVGEEGTVSLSANAHGFNTEKGGTIEVLSPAGITVDTAHLSVLPGESGDGGTISLDAGASMLTLNGDLIADGGISMGNGGVLSLAADGLTLPATANTVLRANSTASGIGGIVSVTTHSQGITVGEGVEQLKIEAKGGDYSNGGFIIVNSDSEITIHGLAADVSSGQNGGNVTVSTLANLVIVGNITANGGDFNGDGGVINLTAAGFSLPPSANTVLLANGGGSGSGGFITITTLAQGITVGNEQQELRLEAKGGDQGDGGWVTINSDFNIDLDGAAIDVSTTGKNGGHIAVVTPVDITSVGVLKVNGGCSLNGAGGTVELSGNSVSFETIGADGGDSNSCVLASIIRENQESSEILIAPATNGNQSGGAININAMTIPSVSLSSQTFLSAIGRGFGKGGSIYLNNVNGIDISSLSESAISAIGGVGGTGEGEGGSISFGNITDIPAVGLFKAARVEGGENLLETVDSGKISFENTICQASNIPNFVPSKRQIYWKCHSNSEPLFGPTLNALSLATKNRLEPAHIYFYYLKDSAAASKTFNNVPLTPHQGYSEKTPHRMVVVYAEIPGHIQALSQLQAVLRHEVGHQIDDLIGTVSQSSYYNELVEQDWAHFNTLNRCVLFPSVCNVSPYNTQSNRTILTSILGGYGSYFAPAANNSTAWREMFAEEFAIAAGGGLDSVLDIWLAYFSCSKAYVQGLYDSGAGAAISYPTGCTPPASPRVDH